MSGPKDPLRYFRVEAREISEELGRGALQLEKEVSPELVQRLMRLAHTLKGAASVVKQRGIAERTHALEDALAPLRDGAPAAGAIETIIAHSDAIAAQVAALDAPADAAPRAAGIDEPFSMLRADIAEMDGLLDGISEASVQVRSVRRTIGMAEQARQLAELIADRVAPGGRQGVADVAAAEKTRAFAEDLRGIAARLEQELKSGIDQSERELEAARTAAERLRLLPCSAAFAGLERAVRDAAQALGKQAVLDLAGGEVRLDAQVLGLVQRALVQLLRNAVAHGIETPAQRRAAGKPETGQVAIEVVQRGNRVAFICADDGAGVDLGAVRRASGASAAASDTDIVDLLLKGGLSTSGTVTEAAGRGVGLDVVREIAARLDGEVTARTEKDRGTRIELTVPVSLASLDALLVETGDTVSAIPLAAVRHTARLVAGEVTRGPEGESIVHDGKVIGFAPLARAMGGSGRAAGPGSAVVIGGGGSALAAIGVERLQGVANVIVRPVPALAFAGPVIAGLYLDARGMPQPVLDAEALVRMLDGAAPAPEAEPEAALPILVIDDSLTTRVLEQSILESAGYDVDLAIHAEEGIEKARQRRYGLFLVDVEMPGMDGFTFVERTRADPELSKTPAILVTSRNAPEDRQRGIDAGARGYIVKSEFDQREVLDLIRGLVGGA
ncbi:response regulator [Sphingomonas sp. LB-2]|uniref:hybrid sensor histidine kinase/response regulator n=1 Tax=Sphingomonas caeni TaxID=2984949 RepID=UPI0022314832|nr:response regulator [Sphingomonas caeni]MCW3846580.1 response regulator [Sphingomonas caeni]